MAATRIMAVTPIMVVIAILECRILTVIPTPAGNPSFS
jgi:hypothetical protein